MKIIHENITKDIKLLMLSDIDIENKEDKKKLLRTIKKLTTGNKFYFEFRREDDEFLTDEEVVKYRYEIPNYFKLNGKYEIKGFIDQKRFDSVGYLIINSQIYRQIFLFWKYFYGVLFFNPTTSINWTKFLEKCDNIKPVEYGIGIIQNNYANSVFMKGHDGDNLIFTYGSNYEEANVNEVIENIGK